MSLRGPTNKLFLHFLVLQVIDHFGPLTMDVDKNGELQKTIMETDLFMFQNLGAVDAMHHYFFKMQFLFLFPYYLCSELLSEGNIYLVLG